MKKLILITILLVFVFSLPAAAKTNFEFDIGLIEGENITEDYIPGAKITLSTDQYNYNDLYDLLEIHSTFGIDDPDYNFIASDLMLYSAIGGWESDGKYIGIGLKHLFLDNSQASDFIFNSDITAYAVPLSLKLEEEHEKLKTFVTASVFQGVYSMTVPGEDAKSDFNGFSIDLGVKFKLNTLDLKLSYKQENYSFDRDKDVFGATDFEDDYKGLFLGMGF